MKTAEMIVSTFAHLFLCNFFSGGIGKLRKQTLEQLLTGSLLKGFNFSLTEMEDPLLASQSKAIQVTFAFLESSSLIHRYIKFKYYVVLMSQPVHSKLVIEVVEAHLIH